MCGDMLRRGWRGGDTFLEYEVGEMGEMGVHRGCGRLEVGVCGGACGEGVLGRRIWYHWVCCWLGVLCGLGGFW